MNEIIKLMKDSAMKNFDISQMSYEDQIEYLKTLDPGEEVELNQCKDKCGDYITVVIEVVRRMSVDRTVQEPIIGFY